MRNAFVSLKGSKKASKMYKSLLGLKCTVNKNGAREKLLKFVNAFWREEWIKSSWSERAAEIQNTAETVKSMKTANKSLCRRIAKLSKWLTDI